MRVWNYVWPIVKGAAVEYFAPVTAIVRWMRR